MPGRASRRASLPAAEDPILCDAGVAWSKHNELGTSGQEAELPRQRRLAHGKRAILRARRCRIFTGDPPPSAERSSDILPRCPPCMDVPQVASASNVAEVPATLLPTTFQARPVLHFGRPKTLGASRAERIRPRKTLKHRPFPQGYRMILVGMPEAAAAVGLGREGRSGFVLSDHRRTARPASAAVDDEMFRPVSPGATRLERANSFQFRFGEPARRMQRLLGVPLATAGRLPTVRRTAVGRTCVGAASSIQKRSPDADVAGFFDTMRARRR